MSEQPKDGGAAFRLPDVAGFWRDVAAIPQIARGQVWCRSCGRSERVNGVRSMQSGWPKCCGSTMTINSPDELAAREVQP